MPVPADKSLCDHCFSKAADERDSADQRLESMVRRVVKESLQEREAQQPRDSPSDPLFPPVGEGSVHETWEVTLLLLFQTANRIWKILAWGLSTL